MSSTDGYRETSGITALGAADVDMATLEDVTAAARLYAQATDRLAGAYTEYMHAVRTLAAAQQAVHEAAQSLTSAEHMLQEGGRLSHAAPQPAPSEPRVVETYASPREPEPEMTDEAESDHDYAPPSEHGPVGVGADGAEVLSTSDREGTGAATPWVTTAEEGTRAGEPAAEGAAPPSAEGGLKVIPRFLGNPPPRISQP